ncbi:MAG: efflux RND transporter periplasmic adaptor subunit [Alphaproteobacteria bacterium]
MKMTRPKLMGVAGAAILVVGGLAFAASHASSGPGPYTFDTATVGRGDVARIVSASGAVEPVTKVDVGSEVSGKIIKLNVDFNDKVLKNQELAQIDPAAFQSAVDQAKAVQAQSDALVAAAKSDIDHAGIALDIAQKTWVRDKELYAKGAIAQLDWETADRDYQFAQVTLVSDNAALLSAKAGLAKSRASLEDSEVQLARTVIRSPIDGVVIARAVDLGQTVQSSMTVANFFTIAQDTSQIQIEASVVESDMEGIDVGEPATFTVDAFPGDRFQGVVSQVRVLGTEAANVVTYTVVISARNSGGKLLPGMTANAEITAQRSANVLRISNDAMKFAPPKGTVASPEVGQKDALDAASEVGNATWLKAAHIDDGRIQKISADLKTEIDALRTASAHAPQAAQSLGGGGPSPMAQQLAAQNLRVKVQQATDAVLRRDLSHDEFDAFTGKRDEASSQKHAVVYAVDEKGKLQRRSLTLGLFDGSYSEIVSGAKEGDAFVTRAHAGSEKKPKPPAAPMAGRGADHSV